MDRSSLRAALRRRRRAISAAQQHSHALKLHLTLAKHPWFKRARRIAFYLANDGELNPLPLLHQAWRLDKKVYLPILQGRPPQMRFRQYRRGDRLLTNRFGIGEPPPSRKECPVENLDLLLMPLVGFDDVGNRLGMGGGFYDRTLAHLRRSGPKRVGVAHSVQKVERLLAEPWDIPLHAVVTEQGIHYF